MPRPLAGEPMPRIADTAGLTVNDPVVGSSCSTVLYDGSCPMCRAEMAYYRQQAVGAPVQWVDVSGAGFADIHGKTRGELMQRFHMIQPDGTLISGASAFAYLWTQVPGWQRLGRLARKPLVLALLESAYNTFLLVRPSMQKVWRWAERRSVTPAG